MYACTKPKGHSTVPCLQGSNNHKQRSSFCVSDGKSTYQAILGGLNSDSYKVKHGPCMCDLKTMCGSCTSMNVIEIYPVYKPFEPTKIKLEEYVGIAIQQEKSRLSFGPKNDVLFARTGDGKLIVQAKHIDFESAVTIKGKSFGQGTRVRLRLKLNLRMMKVIAYCAMHMVRVIPMWHIPHRMSAPIAFMQVVAMVVAGVRRDLIVKLSILSRLQSRISKKNLAF